MPTWLLAPMILAVTWLWAVAAATGHTADARLGVPEYARDGVSVFPVIPLLPIGLWAFSRLIDHTAGSRAAWIVSAIYGALGFLMILSIRRNRGDLDPNDGDVRREL